MQLAMPLPLQGSPGLSVATGSRAREAGVGYTSTKEESESVLRMSGTRTPYVGKTHVGRGRAKCKRRADGQDDKGEAVHLEWDEGCKRAEGDEEMLVRMSSIVMV